jgi:putative glycosyltransferase (TIGR04372 family)
VAQTDLSNVPGNYLCERFAKKGIEFLASGRLHADYDRWAKRHGKLRWDQLSATERFALIDEFWEFEFPDGQVFGYTHAAARVQQEWERQGRPPLLSLTSDDRTFLERVLGVLGLPKNAWYVCLHVREPGFHQNWNAVYPSMRDASIEDYLPAIDLIVKRGGWVIRMGDPSMKPLPPLANVVDYAHSSLKTPHADMLISLGCRFFLGTNSGFATVPAIYGVRCVFSNWLPIGLPFWPSHSLMMPKLFWNEQQERFMTLEEIFRTGVAFVQNWSDLPAGVTLRDNSPEEIRDLASEALGLTPEAADEGLEEARTGYSEIAVRYGSYVGSTLAASFIRHHPSLFVRGEDQDLARGEEPISAAQNAEILDSNTTAVGVESDDGLPAVAAVAGGDRVRS